MLSLSTPEYVVRSTVRAISSAMEKMAFLNSSKTIGSGLADIGVRLLGFGLGFERGKRRLAPDVVFLAEHAGACNRYHALSIHTTPRLRPTPPHERRGEALASFQGKVAPGLVEGQPGIFPSFPRRGGAWACRRATGWLCSQQQGFATQMETVTSLSIAEHYRAKTPKSAALYE